jgi:hypothetical protein
VVERLLFDRVDAETAGAPVGRQHQFLAAVRADEAQPALPVVQLAEPRAKVTLQPAVIEAVPVAGRSA